jgi:hypothetical protein
MAGTLVANTINTDTGLFSTNNAYSGIAKAWVQFTMSGTTITITKSFNVSSVSLYTTGQYVVSFSTALPDANYTQIGSAGLNTASSSYCVYASNVAGGQTTSSFNCGTITVNTPSFANCLIVNIAVLD